VLVNVVFAVVDATDVAVVDVAAVDAVVVVVVDVVDLVLVVVVVVGVVEVVVDVVVGAVDVLVVDVVVVVDVVDLVLVVLVVVGAVDVVLLVVLEDGYVEALNASTYWPMVVTSWVPGLLNSPTANPISTVEPTASAGDAVGSCGSAFFSANGR